MRLVLLALKHLWLRLWHCRVAVFSLAIGVVAMGLPAVKDLFLEPRSDGPISFAVVVLLFWAIPVHRSARASIASIRPETVGWKDLNRSLWPAARAIDKWLPRVLGLCPFLIQAVAILLLVASLSGLKPLPEYEGTVAQLQWTALALLVALIGFGGYLLLRGNLRKKGEVVDTIWSFDPRNFWSVLAMAHTALTVGFFIWAVLFPLSFTGFIGRVALLPVLLGGPLPFLTPIAGIANRTRFPFIAAMALLLVAISAFNDRFHDVRTYEGPYWKAAQAKDDGTVDPAAQRLVDINPAIDAWMSANGCSGAPDKCPEVVLVAAAGGGSRAAFFTTSVLGALLDLTRSHPETYDDLGKTIFAMSGVSGGSVGVTLTRAALADAGAGSLPPCQRSSSLWFGTAYKGRDVKASWRACLQTLAAGDLVSAPIAGLAYRDYIAPPFPLPGPLQGISGDRNVLIEQALEQHYNYVTTEKGTVCGRDDSKGLCRPLGYRNNDTGWVPLLLLNATSIDHGSAIVASDLNTTLDGEGEATAHDIYELFTAAPLGDSQESAPPAKGGVEAAKDLRLSTAAILGARFPGILSAGNIRNAQGELVERVVDGGYFDNSGLGTLVPIHRALLERQLRPIVILIDNEPWEDYDATAPTAGGKERYFSVAGDQIKRVEIGFGDKFGALFLEPLQALNNIRGARGIEAENDFIATLTNKKTFFLADVRRDISANFVADNDPWCQDMPEERISFDGLVVSWWLSPVAQRFVDAQLCGIDNRARLDLLAKALEHGAWAETSGKAALQRTYQDAL